MLKYTYSVVGSAADGQSWQTQGTVEVALGCDFPTVALLAVRDSFMQITKGKAVFGKPGLACSGPYSIQSMTIDKAPDTSEIPEPVADPENILKLRPETDLDYRERLSRSPNVGRITAVELYISTGYALDEVGDRLGIKRQWL